MNARSGTVGLRVQTHALGVAAILILSAAVVFHNLAVPSLWNDEAFSYFVAVDGIRSVVYWLLNDTHPPLYYATLSLWLGLGHGVFVLRSLSAVAMIVAAFFVYLAARTLFGGRTALLAMALFAIAPDCVNWAQKARPYAWQTMFVAIAFWGLAKVFLAAPAREQWLGAGLVAAIRQRRAAPAAIDLAWFAYAVAGGLAMLTQHPAGFFVLGCNCVMAVAIFRDFGRTWRLRTGYLLVNWGIAQLLLIGIWLTWLPAFLVQVAAQLMPEQIATRHQNFLLTPGEMWSLVVGMLSVADLWRVQLPVFVLCITIAAWAGFAFIRKRSAAGLMFLTVLVPIATCVAGFAFLHPIFGYVMATFNWIHVPYAILLACGIVAIPINALRLAALGLVVLANLWGLHNYYATSPPPLDVVAQRIGAAARPGDGIIFSQQSSCRFAIAYYLQSADPHTAGGELAGLDASRDARALIRSAAAAANNARNWVVLPDGEPPAVALADLRHMGSPGLTWHIDDLTVLRFDRQQ